MAISTKSFTTLVRDQVASIQGAASSLVDFTIGSVLRAIVEANATICLWLQGEIIRLLAVTRAATSTGADLDSWVGDFGVTRVPAQAATGNVTFSRFTTTAQVTLSVGTTIQTGDGSQDYTVTADVTNPAYNRSLNAYVINIGTASVTVHVIASVAGAGGNAQAGQINTITQAVPGIDTVTNALTFTNGADAESDVSLRTRFISFIASLSKGTKNAIGYAITSVQMGLNYSLTENFTYGGSSQPGYFYVVVDDGTGAPSGTLLASVGNAIDAVRPFTSTFGVFAPVIVMANASMTITTAAGYVHSDVVALVQAAVTNYINSLPVGATLRYTRLAQIAYDASPGVTNVSTVLLNSGTSDISATAQQIIKSGTVSIT